MKKKGAKISIVDYGLGNLRSITRAFEYLGVDVSITEDAKTILESDAIVLPGDGAFAAGMEGLKIRNLTESVLKFAKSNKPILGICLGAQILMTYGFEFGKHKGLNLIPGKVIKFEKGIGEKVPQIGWNSISPSKNAVWKGTILDGVKPGSNVYFIHSYVIVCNDSKDNLARTRYGTDEFCSTIYNDNIYGCQFHPEKSGAVGLKIIENFIKIVVSNR